MKNKTTPKNLRILIIEDSPIIMRVHKSMVEQMGYKPDCAMDGTQAIKFFQDNEYDIILSDIGLPDITGIALAERFRLTESMRGAKKVYLVAITAFALDDIREQCFISGINDVLNKPLSYLTLEDVFQKAHAHHDALPLQ